MIQCSQCTVVLTFNYAEKCNRRTVLSLKETWGSFVKDYYLARSIYTQFGFVALAAKH